MSSHTFPQAQTPNPRFTPLSEVELFDKMPLTVGTRLGLTRSLRLSARGGMRDMYGATDIRPDRTAAINLLPRPFEQSALLDVNTGPGIIDVDFSVTKNFRFTEPQYTEFRAKFFNIPNYPIIQVPGATVGTATFGVIGATPVDSRQLQLGLKYVF